MSTKISHIKGKTALCVIIFYHSISLLIRDKFNADLCRRKAAEWRIL